VRRLYPGATEAQPNADAAETTSSGVPPTLAAMTLNSNPNYPSVGSYVLKLHRDAVPAGGQLCGRLEHVASGASTDFANADVLLRWLLAHASKTFAEYSRQGFARHGG
jgi:hypothetical protein